MLLKNPIHQIFCVFDKDSHDAKGNHYTNLLSYTKDNNKVIAINSVPCFEYWLLLHFICTCSPFENADAVQKALKKYLPENMRKLIIIFCLIIHYCC